MKIKFYKIECLTNLHVGSSEVNYNIVDNEVEKDAVTGLPIIHASGVKGALRDALSQVMKSDEIKKIFGAEGQKNEADSGSHKFLDALLVSRPMRVWGSAEKASVSVATQASVNLLLDTLNAFGVSSFGDSRLPEIKFGDNEFLTTCDEALSVENEKTGKLDIAAKDALARLKTVLGKDLAVAKTFDGYDLPVVARNCLKGSGNLWYEEVVPRGSVLFFAIICPDDACDDLPIPEIVQFGGNASVGCGFTKITKIAER